MTYWWDSLLGEFAIVAAFIGIVALIAWFIEQPRFGVLAMKTLRRLIMKVKGMVCRLEWSAAAMVPFMRSTPNGSLTSQVQMRTGRRTFSRR